MRRVTVPANYYEQFDADYTLEVPGEGYGGWKKASLPLDLDKTALVVMHAWKNSEYNENPEGYRACEYMPRAKEICEKVFPGLLKDVRKSGLKVYHVVTDESYGATYYKNLPGYVKNLGLPAYAPQDRKHAGVDPVLLELWDFKSNNVFPGKRNMKMRDEAGTSIDFAKEAIPAGDEDIAENSEQLFALCERDGINHLVYIGFALEMCLLMSPGGMCDMSRMGIMCSTIRQAVTATENKETARRQLMKEIGLWRVAIEFGLVYDIDDFTRALEASRDEQD